MTHVTPTRRGLLRGALALGGAGAAMGALPGLASLASAQAGSGYKALVCVYLAGGLDNFDTVIPTDEAEYAVWSEARPSILARYAARGDDSRERANLLPLGAQGDGRRFGMPRQLAPLHRLFEQGRAAVFANVGPLTAPSDRAGIAAGRVSLPPRLMSHNDQKSLWQTSAVEGATTGWAGRMMDAAQSTSPYAAISLKGASTFLAGRDTQPLTLSPKGIGTIHGLTGWAFGSQEVPDLLREHYGASATSLDNYLASDLQARRRRAVDAIERLGGLMKGDATGEEIKVPGNDLSDQLAMVAKLIGQRQALGVTRQVFFVELGGFDTHHDQAGGLPALQTQVAEAMARFYAHTVAQGIAQDVVTFTASDFGRTLTPNTTGTDHGWGGHQIVVGGGIRGGRIVGEVPVAGFGHAQELDRGRLIPSFSTEQYAGSLGGFMGLGEADLREALPRLDRFAPSPTLS